MAASSGDDFDVWLADKLTRICPDVDLDVFVQYVRGVLETDTDLEDKTESITDIVGEIATADLDVHCSEIIKKWDSLNSDGASDKCQSGESKDAFDNYMASAIEAQKAQTYKTKERSVADRERKEAILAQYAQVSDGDGDQDEFASHGAAGGGGGGGDSEKTSADLLAQNMNALSVLMREKDTREKNKTDSDAKKTKDKDDREKQKQKEKDRKEGEKKRTQKGERRR